MIGWQNTQESGAGRWQQSVALIPHEDGDRWWCAWDDIRCWFEMPSAPQTAQQSQRDGLRSRVLEELGLTSRDVLVANMAQLNLEFVGPLPNGPTDADVEVAVSFYLVHLYGSHARDHVEQLVQGRWLTREELLRGQTRDGWAVDPCLCYLLQRADVLPYAR